MKEQGVTPEKIILGGGIGEAYHRFPEPLREAALLEIQDHSGLPEGMILFSAISAEERESAITQAAVDQAAKELAAQRYLDTTTIH
jgi:predicted NBD/HSP70 family sugar kinase